MASDPLRPAWLPARLESKSSDPHGFGGSPLDFCRHVYDSAQVLEIAENCAGLGMLYWDLSQDQIACTAKCKEHFGIPSVDTVSFKHLLNALHPDDREQFEAEIRRAIESRGEFDIESRAVLPDSRLRWLMFKGRIYRDDLGRPLRLAGICMDVTDRKQAEEAWLEAQEHLSEAQHRAHIGIAVRVVAQNKVIWSDEVFRLLGLEPGTVQPSRELLLASIHPDDKQMMAEVFRRALIEGVGSTVTFRVVRPDGTVRVLRGQGDAILGRDGRPEKLFGTAFDITEQTLAEEELAKSRRALEQREEMFRKIVEYSPQATLLERAEEPYPVILVNRKFEELLGYTKDDLRVAADWWTKAYPDEADRSRVQSEWRKRIEEAAVINSSLEPLESVVTCKDGSTRHVEAHMANIGDLNIITLVDMTHRRHAEAALVRTEKLASAGRMAATVAHEINNPLEAITNAVFLVSNSPDLAPKDAELLHLAQGELKRVAQITKQTLGFYRESGSPVRFNLTELVQEVLSLYANRISSRKIDVREKLSPETYVEAVPGELRQVIANFVANAIDAMTGGGTLYIGVSRSRVCRPSGEESVRLTVADTGKGIAPANLPHIFEPFFTTKQDFGTGLGLWVSRGIIEKHFGAIRIRSRQNQGTVVSVYLPAK